MILTLGGSDVNREILDSIEITDPSGKGNLLCSSIPTQLPITLQNSNGALIDGKTIVICGGEEYWDKKATKECYILTNNGFKNLVNMTTKRKMASSIVTKDNKLWVTGGTQDGNYFLKSTELIDIKSLTSTRYVDLPDYMWGHKMVAINESTSILIGGVYDRYRTHWSNATYFFDHLNKIWTPGPSLKFPRNQHTAGLITIQGQPVIVVVGGFDRYTSEYLSSVEILRDLSINGQWEYGKIFTSPGTYI